MDEPKILLSACIRVHLRANYVFRFWHSRASRPSIPTVFIYFQLQLPTIYYSHPHNPNVVRACAGRSLLFGKIRARVKSGLAASEKLRKGAGHGRESILWLIRTSRKRREVTA